MSCFDKILEVHKYFRIDQDPIADGVRCDDKEELKQIDHLLGVSLNAVHEVDKTQRLWLTRSDKHPWVNILKNHELKVIKNILFEIVVMQ